jgi:hypothetical protein
MNRGCHSASVALSIPNIDHADIPYALSEQCGANSIRPELQMNTSAIYRIQDSPSNVRLAHLRTNSTCLKEIGSALMRARRREIINAVEGLRWRSGRSRTQQAKAIGRSRHTPGNVIRSPASGPCQAPRNVDHIIGSIEHFAKTFGGSQEGCNIGGHAEREDA